MAFIDVRGGDNPGEGAEASNGSAGLNAEIEALAAENESIRRYLNRVVDLLGTAAAGGTLGHGARPTVAPIDDLDDELLPDWARPGSATLDVAGPTPGLELGYDADPVATRLARLEAMVGQLLEHIQAR